MNTLTPTEPRASVPGPNVTTGSRRRGKSPAWIPPGTTPPPA